MNSRWIPIYIGIGSNLSDPLRQVIQGIEALRTVPSTRLIATSKMYRSAPLGPQDQPEYVNAAAGMLTQLPAERLLDELQGLEVQQGKVAPIVRWGPRVIDFDILAYGDLRLDQENLQIPHPGIANRAFVLRPLADIAPDLQIPGRGKVCELLRACASADVCAI